MVEHQTGGRRLQDHEVVLQESALGNAWTESRLDGRYRLIRPLAKVTSGGHVFAAQHVHTKRACAVKLLERRSREAVRKRMYREMEALALVQGPGVVEFLDAGDCEGRLFLVLELLEGPTLAGWLAAKGKLEVGNVARIGSRVARILAHCHDHGVVHRDVKPMNVFIATDEVIHLLDFGIAKVFDPERSLEILTRENTILGTPEYMAPEALMASPDVDERADQYALAVTLFECLTGAVPFEGNYAEVLRKASRATTSPVAALGSEIPASLLSAIARALHRRPEDRFADMNEMAEALRGAERDCIPTALFGGTEAARARSAVTIADAPIAKVVAGESRRKFERAPYVTLAHVKLDDGTSIDGRIEEISEAGFQLVSARPVEELASVVVRFALPLSGRIVEMRATCRWARATRAAHAAGFSLLDVGAGPADEIGKYVTLMQRL